jgi:hypothetical protein
MLLAHFGQALGDFAPLFPRFDPERIDGQKKENKRHQQAGDAQYMPEVLRTYADCS